jgi:predicted Zn-dependent protease
VNRRDFLSASGAGCALLAHGALAQSQPDWQPPARFTRPDIASDEGGLWAMMDREERKLRRSPFSLRDPVLREYIRGIVCRLAGEHCPDVRVYLVHTPYFNASMAPNGMLQVWTGLLLRVDNEAQLAAVLGHEIGHYLGRHTLQQLRDAEARSGFAQFLGAFGLVGAIGQLGIVASMFAYTREHERQADRIGALLMRRAGYDVAEAAKIWGNLLLELNAEGGDPAVNSPLFATHPAAEDRQADLARLAADSPGGALNEAAWQAHMQPHLRTWLADEVKRGHFAESIALLTRLMSRPQRRADYAFARGEVYRLRGKDGDSDAALADYKAAAAFGSEPPQTHRGLGMIYRRAHQFDEARASFERYLALAPDAPDALMIRSYLEELHL